MRVFDRNFKNINNYFFKNSAYSAVSVNNNGNIHLYTEGFKQRIDNNHIGYTSAVPDSIIWFCSMDSLDKMFYFKGGAIFSYNKSVSSKIIDLKYQSIICNGFAQPANETIWVKTGSAGIFKITALPYETKNAKIDGYYFHYEKNIKTIVKNNPLTQVPGIAKSYEQIGQITSSVLLSKAGVVWFCTDDGLYKQEPGKKMEHYLFPGDKNFWNESANRVLDAFEAPNGDIWFYGYCGAIRYSNGNFKHYTASNGMYTNGRVKRLVTDKYGTVLLTDDQKILYRVDGDTLIPLNSKLGTTNFIVDKLTTDNAGFAWFEYNKKIFKIEKQPSGKYTITDSIVPYSLSPLPEISAFTFDSQGNCWIGFTGGRIQVYFINAQKRYTAENSVNYSSDNGLAPIAATTYELWPDENGNIVALPAKKGDRQMFIFTLADALERKKLKTPQVSITGILINYKIPDWILMGYTTGPEGVPLSARLTYRNNNIRFNYTGILMSDPSGIVYQVKLEGYDNDWLTTTEAFAQYTNLSPGEYTFMVKAANANGAWSKPAAYHFTILPPWYKTTWAIVLFIILGSGLVFGAFYLRLKEIRKNESLKNLKESNRFKSRLIGVISHDVMTPLRYIAKVSFQLKTHNQSLSTQTTLESLGDINTTATQLHFFGEGVIHWIKLQSEYYKPVFEKINLTELVDELVGFHQAFMAEKRNNIINALPPDMYCIQDATLIKIIIHNLLLNADKFTQDGTIMVRVVIENKLLNIFVSDNGSGMSEQKVNSLNNLVPVSSAQGTNMETGWGMGYMVIIDLLKLSKGTLHVESRINKGTTVNVKLPCADLNPDVV